MFINTLKIHNFRNIKFKEFNFTKRVNVFFGENGSGKTSILESIYFLSSAKSFRKSSAKSIINFDEEKVTVYSKLTNDITYSFAVTKDKTGKWSGKVNNTVFNKQSQLTSYLKVVAIDPEVYRLIDFGPQFRRSFLDWFVFHVEHSYLDTWKKTYKCIKQLNHLYKTKASNIEINVWETSLAEFSELLNQKRLECFDLLKPRILSLVKKIQPDIRNLKIEFKKGWQESNSLLEQLTLDRIKNLKYGQIQNGPHKMDIKILANNFPASQTLSRGQKKILSIIFYLAYIESLMKDYGLEPIVCLDDLDAEIDESKLNILGGLFDELNIQLFISTVQVEKVKNIFKDIDMFHVEQC